MEHEKDSSLSSVRIFVEPLLPVICSVWSKIFCSSSISSWQPLLHLLVVSVFFLSFAYPFPRSYSNACHILFFFLQTRVFLILYLYANRVWNITTVYVQIVCAVENILSQISEIRVACFHCWSLNLIWIYWNSLLLFAGSWLLFHS